MFFFFSLSTLFQLDHGDISNIHLFPGFPENTPTNNQLDKVRLESKTFRSGSVFTNHSLECSLSYSPDFSIHLAAFECNATSDWLNRNINQSEVVLHSNFHNLGEKDRECS